MLFGLYSASAIFQNFINNILYEYLDIFVSIYINNFLIYSNSLCEYREYIRAILQKLREASLYINIEKCVFYIEEILYLGIIIGRYSIKIDPEKVAAIKE